MMSFERETIPSPFWIVWNPERGLPRMKHGTAAAARAEARRLARTNPTDTFVVMQAVALLRVRDPVEEVQFDELPF